MSFNLWFHSVFEETPYQFIKYCENRDVAFQQITTTGIDTLGGLIVLGAEIDLNISVNTFEQHEA
ncbi:unnamed protein product [Arabis nemorensis]|uniref:Uncharacterized protein n=1 Tax=Arabis nemorensis TaxID=586526 RepID=A0A565AXR4_9BRAS|nr:unnamed protein product [Arabis nemorensis]